MLPLKLWFGFLRGGLSCEEGNLRRMVFGQGMSVFNIRGQRGCVYICVVFLSECVFDWCKSATDVISIWEWLWVFMCMCTHLCFCVSMCLSPVPSLGRRQSQCWGCSLAAPAASQANLGGEKHFDPGLQVWGSPAGGSAALQSILDLFLSNLQASHTPQRGSLNCTLSVPLRQYVMVHTWVHMVV